MLALAAISGTAATTGAHSDHSPLQLHPDNPHYFLFRGKPTLLITSGEHYGALLNLEFDFNAYFAELHKHGLNLTRTFCGTYREVPGSFNITQNTLAPEPGQYLAPWARSSEPGYALGGNKFDLNLWDPAYFKRLHAFMRAASAAGVVVEMNLFCPNYEASLWHANPMYTGNNVNSVGNCPPDEAYTLKHPDLLNTQLSVVRKLVAELAAYDNLYYEVCNEPYFGGVTMEWQKRVIHEIQAAETGMKHPHLISLNIANGSASITEAVPGVSIFNFHYATPPDTVGLNYHLNKVIGDNETGFRGSADLLYRSEAWEFLLAGGALYNNLDYSFSVAHPSGDLSGYHSPGGGSPALRHQLSILKKFMEGADLLHLQPSQSLLMGGLPAQTAFRVLANPQKHVLVYLRGGRPESMEVLLHSGKYHIQWIDPEDGHTIQQTEMHHDGEICRIAVPIYKDDVAVKITRK